MLLPLPDRIWIVRKEFSDYTGTRLAEVIVTDQAHAVECRVEGWEVTAYLSEPAVLGGIVIQEAL